MQRITLISIGKLNQKFLADGVAEYTKRLGVLCQFTQIELAEQTINEKNASEASIANALQKEGDKILSAVPKGAKIVALCVEGKQLSSESFADWIAGCALEGSGDIAFVIGSSHGLHSSVKQQAALKLSLSGMTLPHQLARLVLCEQLYRAFMIQNGSKYHK